MGSPPEVLHVGETTLGGRWKAGVAAAAANTGFDYLALLFALRAVGANPRPSLVVLAYTAAELLALLPFTPGGLGFVEAGLVGTLTVAGVPGSDALPRRCCTGWPPTGCRFPPAASRTCCSATATTDAMRVVEFPAQRHVGRQATNGLASSVRGRRW
jgi:Lysylphosphatidylglycerol synthase TM region